RLGAKFSFEPGFEYEVESRRERLYHSNHFNRKMVLPRYRDYKMPMDSLIKTSRLRYQQQPKINGTRLSKDYKNIINEGGSFQFTFQDSLNHLVAIALKNDSSSTIKQVVPSLRRFSKLSSSTYTLLLVNQNFQTFCYHFEAKKDTLLFTNINYPSWQATADSILQKWFPSDQIISPENPFLSLEEKVLPLNFMNSREIRGQVTDSNSGEPLIYASVLIKGANIGTTTDLDGYYFILIPNGIENPVLEVMYTGYESEEVPVSYGRLVDIALKEGAALGQEILVVAYSTKNGRKISRAAIKALPSLHGEAVKLDSKIKLRGKNNNNKRFPLENGRYFIQQFGDSTSIDTVVETELEIAPSRIRSNFQDYAYWNPNLMTDQNGEAYFTVTYPDNITSWNTFVVGMDKKLRAGVAYGNTKSYKPLLAQLATPRFLVEGDESDLIGKAVNYTNDTLSITTKFELAGKEIQSNSTDLVDGFVEKIKVDAPEQSDSLHFQYQLQMGDYFDGEKRSIPVVRRGVEAVKGKFKVLDRDTSVVYEPLRQS
ncbi:MAG: alpha-2-macroglobulin family protein, partial [Bacteroidota bacterium]